MGSWRGQRQDLASCCHRGSFSVTSATTAPASLVHACPRHTFTTLLAPATGLQRLFSAPDLYTALLTSPARAVAASARACARVSEHGNLRFPRQVVLRLVSISSLVDCRDEMLNWCELRLWSRTERSTCYSASWRKRLGLVRKPRQKACEGADRADGLIVL